MPYKVCGWALSILASVAMTDAAKAQAKHPTPALTPAAKTSAHAQNLANTLRHHPPKLTSESWAAMARGLRPFATSAEGTSLNYQSIYLSHGKILGAVDDYYQRRWEVATSYGAVDAAASTARAVTAMAVTMAPINPVVAAVIIVAGDQTIVIAQDYYKEKIGEEARRNVIAILKTEGDTLRSLMTDGTASAREAFNRLMEINSFKSQLDAAKAIAPELSAEFDAIYEKSIAGFMNTLAYNAAIAEQNIADLSERQAKTESATKELRKFAIDHQRRVDAAINTIQRDVSGLKSSVDHLEKRQFQIDARVDALDNRVSAIEKYVFTKMSPSEKVSFLRNGGMPSVTGGKRNELLKNAELASDISDASSYLTGTHTVLSLLSPDIAQNRQIAEFVSTLNVAASAAMAYLSSGPWGAISALSGLAGGAPASPESQKLDAVMATQREILEEIYRIQDMIVSLRNEMVEKLDEIAGLQKLTWKAVYQKFRDPIVPCDTGSYPLNQANIDQTLAAILQIHADNRSAKEQRDLILQETASSDHARKAVEDFIRHHYKCVEGLNEIMANRRSPGNATYFTLTPAQGEAETAAQADQRVSRYSGMLAYRRHLNETIRVLDKSAVPKGAPDPAEGDAYNLRLLVTGIQPPMKHVDAKAAHNLVLREAEFCKGIYERSGTKALKKRRDTPIDWVCAKDRQDNSALAILKSNNLMVTASIADAYAKIVDVSFRHGFVFKDGDERSFRSLVDMANVNWDQIMEIHEGLLAITDVAIAQKMVSEGGDMAYQVYRLLADPSGNGGLHFSRNEDKNGNLRACTFNVLSNAPELAHNVVLIALREQGNDGKDRPLVAGRKRTFDKSGTAYRHAIELANGQMTNRTGKFVPTADKTTRWLNDMFGSSWTFSARPEMPRESDSEDKGKPEGAANKPHKQEMQLNKTWAVFGKPEMACNIPGLTAALDADGKERKELAVAMPIPEVFDRGEFFLSPEANLLMSIRTNLATRLQDLELTNDTEFLSVAAPLLVPVKLADQGRN